MAAHPARAAPPGAPAGLLAAALLAALLAGCAGGDAGHPPGPGGDGAAGPTPTDAAPTDAAPKDAATAAGAPEAAAPPGPGQGVRLRLACIPVHFPGAAPAPVVGTLYAAPGVASGPVLLFVLGVHTQRGDLDAGFAEGELAAGLTPPRMLAATGWSVLVIDRPGVGDSPYTPEATDVEGYSFARQVEALHQVVGALREGVWTAGPEQEQGPGPDAACPESPAWAATKVALAGHSLGGLLAMQYATAHGDVAGIGVVAADSDGQYNRETVAHSLYCQAAHGDPAHRRTQFFCVDDVPGMPGCVSRLFAAPANATVAEGFCAAIASRTEPAQAWELVTTNPVAIRAGRPAVADVPIHFVAMGGDLVFSEPGRARADAEAEVAAWREGCPGCEVTLTYVPDVGHAWVGHPGTAAATAGLAAWLAGLA